MADIARSEKKQQQQNLSISLSEIKVLFLLMTDYYGVQT